jgi:hypothetical protein
VDAGLLVSVSGAGRIESAAFLEEFCQVIDCRVAGVGFLYHELLHRRWVEVEEIGEEVVGTLGDEVMRLEGLVIEVLVICDDRLCVRLDRRGEDMPVVGVRDSRDVD